MDDERAIRELIHAWLEATKAGDTAKILELMTDDVIFMAPGQEPFGKQEFKAGLEQMKGAKIDVTGDIKELKVIGDWAYLRNHLEVRMTMDGKTEEHSGYTLSILHKSGGRWRLVRDANIPMK